MTEPRKHTLPTDSAERKMIPLWDGLMRYAPAALAGVARASMIGNLKHNPGEELHHARGKSADHGNCILRHMIDAEEGDGIDRVTITHPDGRTETFEVPHVDWLAWRALMKSQEWHEKRGAPLAPGAKLPEPVPGPWTVLPTPYFAPPFTVSGACFHVDSVRCDNCRGIPLPPEPGVSTVTSTSTNPSTPRTDEGTGA